MSTRLILSEADALGFKGNSVKIESLQPYQVQMKLYKVSNGKSVVVQSGQTKISSKNFDFGYLFHPTANKDTELSFMFYDHDRGTKEGLASKIAIDQPNPHKITKQFANSLSSMHIRKTGGETVIYLVTNKSNHIMTQKFEDIVSKVSNGYIITAKLIKKANKAQ